MRRLRGYVNDFASTQFGDVAGDYQQTNRAQRGRLLLYGCLLRADFKPPQYSAGTTFPYSVVISINQNLRAAVTAQLGRDRSIRLAGHGVSRLRTSDQLSMQSSRCGRPATRHQDFCDDIRWSSTEPIYTGATDIRPRPGWRNLIDLKDFHNADTQRDPG